MDYTILVLIAVAGVIIGILLVNLIVLLFFRKKKNSEIGAQGELNEEPDEVAVSQVAESAYSQENKLSYEEWLRLETDNVNRLIDQEEDPLKYIAQQLKTAKKDGVAEHFDALSFIQSSLKTAENEKAEDVSADKSAEEEKTVYVQSSAKSAEKDRMAFIAAKVNGSEVIVPMLRFTMSRNDIIDYLADVGANHAEDFPEGLFVDLRRKKLDPDFVKIANFTFGLIYGTIYTYKISLRLGREEVSELKKHCAVVEPNKILGSDWHDIAVDSSFIYKEEVYVLFDISYTYAKKTYFSGGKLLKDYVSAEIDKELNINIQTGLKTADAITEVCAREYHEALEKFNAAYPLEFKSSRAHVLQYYHKNNEKGAVSVNENIERPYLPASVKYDGNTFALIYRKLDSFSLVVRLDDTYMRSFELTHPTVRRAQFPKGRFWYLCDVNGSFPDLSQVYLVLENAKTFIKDLYAKKPRKAADSE